MRLAPLILALYSSFCLLAAVELPPSVADYAAFLTASELATAGKYAEALSALEPVWVWRPESPLSGKSAVLATRSYLALSKPEFAVTTLDRYAAKLPQPEGSLLSGDALLAAGQLPRAAAAYQKVFYSYPLSPEAVAAEAALQSLETQLGEGFPPVVPSAMLDRAAKLMRGGRSVDARKAYLQAAPRLAGSERDLALVRAGAGDVRYLAALEVATPAADAERLYLLHAASRKTSNEAQAAAALEELNRKYPKSQWRLEALVSWGNHFVMRNDANGFVSQFQACVDGFPSDPQAAYCDWKLTWNAWMQRSPDARERMRKYLERYPESEKAAAANYFLGNYKTVVERYPLTYYAVLAKAKAPQAKPVIATRVDLSPNALVRRSEQRAQALSAAGLFEWAEFELKSVADLQPYLVAADLSEEAAKQGEYARGLRYVKSLARGYLNLPLEAAPERFWKQAFPLPYRPEVEKASIAQDLDPYFMAGLMRQESEFDAKVVSHANAYGLTQVLPGTGRELSRRLGMRSFETSMLFDPAINLRLGTLYIRQLLQAHGGREAETLASYNAGKRRVTEWLRWYPYRETAEFIETIPITETRNYVQIVLRNADVYRRLYGK